MGTAEACGVVEEVPDIADSPVVDTAAPFSSSAGGPSLFVVLGPGATHRASIGSAMRYAARV